MSEFPKGSYIVREGERRKILEELGCLRFYSMLESSGDDWETTSVLHAHIKELKDKGWKPEGEKWKPKYGEEYESVHIYNDKITVEKHSWVGDSTDLRRRYLGNVYLVGQGEAAAERVKKALKGE